jgi:hypothetical protein
MDLVCANAPVSVGIGRELTETNSATPSTGIGSCSAPWASKLRSNLGAATPKQQGKPGIIRDQKTKPGTTNHNPCTAVRSA